MQNKIITSTASQTQARYNVALLGAETEQALNFRMTRVPPNGGPPVHKHVAQAETFHVSEGVFLFQVDGDEIRGETGDTIFIPRGIPHGYVNIGDEEARLVSVLTPGIQDGFILDVAKAQQEGASVAELSALAEQFGTVVLGPPLSAPALNHGTGDSA